MKRMIFAVLVFITGCGLMACANKESAGETSKVESEPRTIVTQSQMPEIVELSDTEKEIYFYRDDMKIFGKVHLPEGEGPFPVLIFAGGFGAPYTYTEDYAKVFADNGIAGVVFDYVGAYNFTPSGGNYLDKTIFTEVADLHAVLDGVLTLPEIDREHLFLWGHSFGGIVATCVAAERVNEVEGLLLVEPAYYMHDLFKELYPEGTEIPIVLTEPLVVSRKFVEDLISFDSYDRMQEFDKDVLLFMGTVDEEGELEVQLDYYGRAVETFPSAQMEMVDGADHYFMGEPGEKMMDSVIDFINKHINAH